MRRRWGGEVQSVLGSLWTKCQNSVFGLTDEVYEQWSRVNSSAITATTNAVGMIDIRRQSPLGAFNGVTSPAQPPPHPALWPCSFECIDFRIRTASPRGRCVSRDVADKRSPPNEYSL